MFEELTKDRIAELGLTAILIKPTSVAQVRCRDCKFWEPLESHPEKGECSCLEMNTEYTDFPDDGLRAQDNRFVTGPRFYCPHAESK